MTSLVHATLPSEYTEGYNELLEDARRNFNTICFGCTFSSDDCASFRDRGTTGVSAVAMNSMAFNQLKYDFYIQMLQDYSLVDLVYSFLFFENN